MATVTSIKRFPYKGKVYDLNIPKEHNYTVGGVSVHNSAGGSEICYLTGITEVDPIKNHLLFDRFLNKARKSMPDIDSDIPSDSGTPGISGKDMLLASLEKDLFPFTGQIVNDMRATTVILFKQLAKVFDIPFQDVNRVTTDTEVAEEFFYEDEYTGWLEEQLRKMGIHYDNKWKEFEKYIDFCYKYGGHNHGDYATGVLYNTSIHASGVILYPSDDPNILPKNKQGVIYRGHALEEMGYIKYDLLGLTSLDPISYFQGKIKAKLGMSQEDDFPWEKTDDPEVWDEVFKKADTDFVFQFSSPGMKRALRAIKPGSIDKLAELNAVYRPGCIKAGIFEQYVNDEFDDEAKVVGKFLKEEFGEEHTLAMIFQEDIMKVVEKMAGFTLVEADLVRRAIQRKQKDVMESYKEQFIENFDTEKYGPIAEKVWDAIDAFATYCFNRSHSVAYGCIAYWTAYIFHYFKNEYFEYMLNHDIDKKEAISYLSKDHKIAFPTLETKNTKFEVTDTQVLVPTVTVQDQTVGEYLLSLDADKNKMIVKYGVLDDFCVDRKGLREVFKEIPQKKIDELTDQQWRGIRKAKKLKELLTALSAVDLIDFEKATPTTYKIGVHKAKSIKEFYLRTIADAEVLAHNVQEDVRAYGIVRSKYVDEAPIIPTEEIQSSYTRNWLNTKNDKTIKNFWQSMRKQAEFIADHNSDVRYINQKNMVYRAVLKEAKLGEYPKATLIFSNDTMVVSFGKESRVETDDGERGDKIVDILKAMGKNTPVEVSFNLSFSIKGKNAEEVRPALKIRNIEKQQA